MYIKIENTIYEKNLKKNKECKYIKSFYNNETGIICVFYISKYYYVYNNFKIFLGCNVVTEQTIKHFVWSLTPTMSFVSKKKEIKINYYTYKYLITRNMFNEAFNNLLEYIPCPKEMEEHREEIYRACFL